MTTFQFALLCVGALILLTSFDLSPVWNVIKGLASRVKTPQTPPLKSEDDHLIENEYDNDLLDVVKKWNDLRIVCEKLDLTEAVNKLDEIFPVLIKVDTTKVEK